jgi:hypothetical protein
VPILKASIPAVPPMSINLRIPDTINVSTIAMRPIAYILVPMPTPIEPIARIDSQDARLGLRRQGLNPCPMRLLGSNVIRNRIKAMPTTGCCEVLRHSKLLLEGCWRIEYHGPTATRPVRLLRCTTKFTLMSASSIRLETISMTAVVSAHQSSDDGIPSQHAPTVRDAGHFPFHSQHSAKRQEAIPSTKVNPAYPLERERRAVRAHGSARAKALLSWIVAQGIDTALIEPGKPWQNGVAESFNGKFRDERLTLEWFRTRAETKPIIERWRRHYNEVRPPSSLGYLTPNEFAAQRANAAFSSCNGPGRCGIEASAPRPVAQSAPQGQHGASKGRRLKLTVVRKIRAGHWAFSQRPRKAVRKASIAQFCMETQPWGVCGEPEWSGLLCISRKAEWPDQTTLPEVIERWVPRLS